jgi:myosin heavy subunit
MSQNREFWFIPDDQEVFVPALVMGKAPNSGIANMTVVGDNGEPLAGKVVSVEIDNCIRIEDPSILKDAPDDYIALASVNEAAILYNAKKRFFEKKIYTSCGAVLMSVNPFERIPNLYGDEVMAKYRHAMSEDLTAHVYLIPSRAYLSMSSFGRNQSLLISGESGAGKTEATKQCLSFLAAIAGASVTGSSSGGERRRKSKLEGTKDEAIDISNRIIAASPILESFGNAQTLRNPNSSRFGTYYVLRSSFFTCFI